MSPILLMSAVVLLAAASLTLIGLSRRRAVVDIDERLAHFGERPVSIDDEELKAPFGERIVKPAIRRMALRLAQVMPSKSLEKVRGKLAEAGNPSGLGPKEFLGLRGLLCLTMGGGAFLLFTLSGGASGMAMMMPVCLAVFGYVLPGIWLDRKIRSYKKEMTRSLPDAIDLLTISVESGLGFDPALMRVAEKWDNVLTREFARVLSEMRIGKSKREALREMADRCNVDDLNIFISAVIQADQLGVSISQVLRVQSDAMRVRRRQRAEELAHKAPIKMLFPMVFLIFPALYVVILGPAVPRLIAAFQ